MGLLNLILATVALTTGFVAPPQRDDGIAVIGASPGPSGAAETPSSPAGPTASGSGGAGPAPPPGPPAPGASGGTPAPAPPPPPGRAPPARPGLAPPSGWIVRPSRAGSRRRGRRAPRGAG